MLSSLFSGTSGVKANMNSMSVIGNNLSNMNTIGFKGSRVSFNDLMSQNLSSLSGSNQLGLGVMTGSIDPVFSQGGVESTSSATDMAIEGDGFFVVKNGAGSTYYTRAGQFSFDKSGLLVDPSQNVLQGYLADSAGNIGSATSDIQLDFAPVQPRSSTAIDMVANLDSNSDVSGFVFELGVNDTIDITLDPLGAATQYSASLITDDGLVEGQAYTGEEVAAAIKTALEAKAPGTKFSVAYTPITGTFNITSDTTNVDLELNWSTSNIADTLGFTAVDSGLIAGGVMDSSDVTAGNFDVGNPVQTSNFSTAVTVYDSLGNPHQVSVYFRKSDIAATGNTWEWFAVVEGEDSTNAVTEIQAQGTLDFSTGGALNSESAITYNTTSGGFEFAGGPTQGQVISFDFGNSITEGSDGLTGVTQYSEDSFVFQQNQDGYPVGTLQRTFVDKDGVVMGIYSNGISRALAQVAMADFTNAQGLEKVGGNLFAESNSSGTALVGTASTGGLGLIHSSSLELSTVDIAEEFVKMITAQRGFQANSRVITTTDEILNELVNLKR